MSPALYLPTASDEPLIKVRVSPLQKPSREGPAVTIIEGIFNLKDSIKIDELEENKQDSSFLKEHIISIEDLFIKLYGEENKIILDEKRKNYFLNGVKLTYSLPEGNYRIYDENSVFIGIGCIVNKILKREIVVWCKNSKFDCETIKTLKNNLEKIKLMW